MVSFSKIWEGSCLLLSALNQLLNNRSKVESWLSSGQMNDLIREAFWLMLLKNIDINSHWHNPKITSRIPVNKPRLKSKSPVLSQEQKGRSKSSIVIIRTIMLHKYIFTRSATRTVYSCIRNNKLCLLLSFRYAYEKKLNMIRNAFTPL